MGTENAPDTLSHKYAGRKQLPPIQPYKSFVAQSTSPHSPMSPVSQEFVSICRETELKFVAALALDKLGAMASPTEAAQVAGAIATELLPSPCTSTDGSNGSMSVVVPADLKPRCNSSSRSPKRHCYATDSALQDAVNVLCEQLVQRCQQCPLPHGEADAELRCSRLEQEISRLEALAADQTLTDAQRLAAEQQLDALKECKCYELDLVCTLMEQQDAAEELTGDGAAVFEKNWGIMMKLEGRVWELKKQLADKHGVRVILQQFPLGAADEVLMLAAAHDTSHGRYRAWAWKMMQRVNDELLQSKQQLVKGLKKSSSMPSRLLAMRVSKCRKCKSSSTAANAAA